MQDQILPPLAEPTGPRQDDEIVARAFARREYAGHSPRFHVEGPALMVDRMDAAALRVGPDAVLVRRDLGEGLLTAQPLVERALASEGLVLVDADTLLAAPVAIQVLGLRLSCWDLWGTDADQASEALRLAALGDQLDPVPGQDPAG